MSFCNRVLVCCNIAAFSPNLMGCGGVCEVACSNDKVVHWTGALSDVLEIVVVATQIPVGIRVFK